MADRGADAGTQTPTPKRGRRGEYSGPRCEAKLRGSRAGGKCRKPAGWGTDHLGYGPCRTHGGLMPVHRQRAALAMAQDEMRKAIGVPVLLRRVDRDTIRAVVLAVLARIEPTVEQQAVAREALAAELAALQTISHEQAKRYEQEAAQRRRRPKRQQADDSSALAPSPDEEAALDALVRPTVLRRKKKSNRKEGSR